MNKIIYMTYKNQDFPKDLVFERWTKLNPDWKIEFSTDNDCVIFLDQYFGKEYVELFDFIKYGANKADLWRLCKLYINGGIYADIDLIPLVEIENIISDSDICTCSSLNPKSFFQAFIWVKEKRNPLIMECIRSLLKNKYKFKWNDVEPTYDMYSIFKKYLKTEIYGNNEYVLNFNKYPTLNLSKSFANSIVNYDYKVRILKEHQPTSDWRNCYVKWTNVDVFKSRDINYYNARESNKIWK